MKTKDVIIGQTYEVRVSGKLVKVRIDLRTERSAYRFSRTAGQGSYEVRTYFKGTNLKTGRKLELRASRLRKLVAPPGCKCPSCQEAEAKTAGTPYVGPAGYAPCGREYGSWEAHLALCAECREIGRAREEQVKALVPKLALPSPAQLRDMEDAHAEGLHSEVPREFCPECRQQRVRS